MPERLTTCDHAGIAADIGAQSQGADGLVFLLDGEGRVVAASGEGQTDDARRWIERLGKAPELAAAIARIDEGSQTVSVLAAAGACPEAPAQLIRLQRLEGPLGSFVLVSVSPAPIAGTTDVLTGLPDRRAVADYVARAQFSSGAGAPEFALLFVDLDNFKDVNDRHGHLVGDEALAHFARRLTSCVREGDLVARFGGDEFVVIIQRVTSLEECDVVRKRIEAALSRPLRLADCEIILSASVGAAIARAEDSSVEQLIEAADRDMYARKRGRYA